MVTLDTVTEFTVRTNLFCQLVNIFNSLNYKSLIGTFWLS